MAKYNKTQLYFYKLPASFFERDEVEWLKTQYDGHKKIIVYLELIFKTINKNGVLGRVIGDKIMPYSTSDLARLINEDEELVEETLNDFVDIGFITKREDGTYFLEDALDLTNQSVSARKKEIQRRENSCPPDIDKEKDEEKEIDNRNNILDTISRQRQLEVDLESEESELYCAFLDYCERKFLRKLSISEQEDLKEIVKIYEQKEIKLAIDQAAYNDKLFLGYAIGILQNRNEWGKEDYDYV